MILKLDEKLRRLNVVWTKKNRSMFLSIDMDQMKLMHYFIQAKNLQNPLKNVIEKTEEKLRCNAMNDLMEFASSDHNTTLRALCVALARTNCRVTFRQQLNIVST